MIYISDDHSQHQTKEKASVLPDNGHISLGEELPGHLDELKQHRAPTVFLTPAIEMGI